MKNFYRKLKGWWWINSSRVYLREINEEFAASIEKGSVVLDAGAGSAPYRELFEHTQYETADFEQLEKAYFPSTYVCDLKEIPVESERFDYIIFNQTLEHLPEPLLVLNELNRILKTGGKIMCTCPLFFEEHEQPYDFYRYTQFAHRFLFKESGYEIVSLEWMEGYFGTVGYQFESMNKYLPLNPKLYPNRFMGILYLPFILSAKLVGFLMAGVFYRLDLRFKFCGSGLPKNYVVIATKI